MPEVVDLLVGQPLLDGCGDPMVVCALLDLLDLLARAAEVLRPDPEHLATVLAARSRALSAAAPPGEDARWAALLDAASGRVDAAVRGA